MNSLRGKPRGEFIIIFAFSIYFQRIQNVHTEIEVYRKNLESIVRDRTGQLKETK